VPKGDIPARGKRVSAIKIIWILELSIGGTFDNKGTAGVEIID
jgi:hypothetical protein